MAETLIPKYVRDFAGKHRVPLAEVAAQDASAGMTLIDVSDWAKAKGNTELMAAALGAQFEWNAKGTTQASSAPHRRGTVTPGQVKGGTVNAMARNPLVDRVRAVASAAGVPAPGGTPPGLFAAGDLPSFTASGIPPQSLLEVPWQARHAMAAAATPAEAYAIRTECTGSDASTTASMLYGSHPGNEDYTDRVNQWQVASMSDDQLFNTYFPGAKDELNRREATMSLDLPPEDQAKVAQLSQYGR